MWQIWSCGLMLILTGCVSAEQGAPDAGTYAYHDVLKPHGHARDDAARQAAAAICDGGKPQNVGRPAFDACMRARGWRLARLEPAPVQSGASGGIDPVTQAGIDADTAATQAQSDADIANANAVAAASTQTLGQ